MATSRAIEAAKAFVRIYADDTQLRKTLAGLKGQLATTSEAFSGIATSATIAGIGAAAAGMVMVGANAERTAASFEVMLGSAEAAKTMLDQIYALGKESPFGAAEFQQAAQVLLNFGASAESVIPTMSMLGDVAAGDANKLRSLSLVFGQMSATGRLMGQDLLQFINAGFNPLQQIAERTGESMSDLKKRMEAGGISATEVAQAFKDATSEGGRFAGMTQRISKTTIGVWMTLQDEIMMLANDMSQYLLPAVNMALRGFSGLVRLFSGWGKGIVYAGAALAGFLGIMKALTLAQIAYGKAAAVAQAFTGPKGWAMLAVGAAAAAAAVAAIDLSTQSLAETAKQSHPPMDTMAKDLQALATSGPGAVTVLEDVAQAADDARKTIAEMRDPVQKAKDTIDGFAAALAKSGEFGMVVDGNPLVEAFRNQESGYTETLRKIRDEISVLSGAATEAGLELQNMLDIGVDPAKVEELRTLMAQRDQLLQKKQNEEWWKQRDEQMKAAAEEVKESLRTVQDSFALERQRLNQMVQEGYLSQAQADAALKKNPKFAALADGMDPAGIANASNAANSNDLRSAAGAAQLTGLLNGQRTVQEQQLSQAKAMREELRRLRQLAENDDEVLKI